MKSWDWNSADATHIHKRHKQTITGMLTHADNTLWYCSDQSVFAWNTENDIQEI